MRAWVRVCVVVVVMLIVVDVEVVVSRRHKADSQIPQPMLREVRHCLVLDGIFPKLTLS